MVAPQHWMYPKGNTSWNFHLCYCWQSEERQDKVQGTHELCYPEIYFLMLQQILLCLTIYTLPKQVENACTVFLWLNSIWWILVCCLSRVRERTIHNGLEDHRRASRAILTSSLWRGKNFVHLILIVVGHRRSIFNDENFTIYRYI